MTAAALLAWRDLRRAGWVDAELEKELGEKVVRARVWLIANTTDAMLNDGGYRRVTGATSPWPPENLVWLMAWTLEALMQIDDL